MGNFQVNKRTTYVGGMAKTWQDLGLPEKRSNGDMRNSAFVTLCETLRSLLLSMPRTFGTMLRFSGPSAKNTYNRL
jgi:hypothetical protein